jgi:hypothetical protein
MHALAPELQMNTMRIATPVGYSSRPPPRRVWPIVFAIAVLLGIVGGLLVARPGRTSLATGSGSAAGAVDVVGQGAGEQAAIPGGSSATSAGSNVIPAIGSSGGSSGAASEPGASAARSNGAAAATDDPRAKLAVAHLSIDSVPPRALVTGPDGASLGRTPLRIEWPISDAPVTFELVLAGYTKKQKRTVINGNTALHIELERTPVTRRRASGSAKPGRRDNGLMNPN